MLLKNPWISVALLAVLAAAGRSEAEAYACSFLTDPMQSTEAPGGSATDPALGLGPGDLVWMAIDCECCADCAAQYEVCASSCLGRTCDREVCGGFYCDIGCGTDPCEMSCFDEARLCVRSCGPNALNGCRTQC